MHEHYMEDIKMAHTAEQWNQKEGEKEEEESIDKCMDPEIYEHMQQISVIQTIQNQRAQCRNVQKDEPPWELHDSLGRNLSKAEKQTEITIGVRFGI